MGEKPSPETGSDLKNGNSLQKGRPKKTGNRKSRSATQKIERETKKRKKKKKNAKEE